MKKILLFTGFLFVTTVVVSAQNRDLDAINEMLDLRDTKSERISRARRALLDKFLEDDFEATAKLTAYLKDELEDENYTTLYPSEYWMLCYWLGNYEKIIEELFEWEQDSENVPTKYAHYMSVANSGPKIAPQNDVLYEKLKSASIGSKPFLHTKLHESPLDEMEKDFLAMFLDNIVSDRISYYYAYQTDERERLNDTADAFLEKYPGSAYEDFTRKYLRYKTEMSKWGIGYDLGGGVSVFDGNIAQTLNTGGSFNLGLDVIYARFTVQMRLLFSFCSLKNDMELGYNTVWEKKYVTQLITPELSLAFNVLDTDFLRIAPFGGISPLLFSPNEKSIEDNPDLKDTKFNSPGYVFGMNFDWKFGDKYTFGMIRLRYGFYNSLYHEKYPDFPELNGHFHNISISIGMSSRNQKRSY
jgi:hypothetical protein